MAKIFVAFESEQAAQSAIRQLSEAGIGEVRARVVDDTGTSSEMLTPDLGRVEVRPSAPPEIPGAEPSGSNEDKSSVIPTTGSGSGVQVMIEVDDEQEQRVRQILSQGSDTAG